ncbi:MAG: hypothetical protein ACMG6E_07805, partial [Candidatus Roizmanbacteria bacterium]
SVLGTISTYTGASAFSFDFNLPKGLAGFGPSLGLSYSSQSIDDSRIQDPYFYLTKNMPSEYGLGFGLSGTGSIVRDTKGEKDVLTLGTVDVDGKQEYQLHHSFILSIPGGVSAEVRFNQKSDQWVTSPQAFLDIQHNNNEEQGMLVADGTDRDPFKILDGGQWIITTKDGTKYYFGESDIRSKLDAKAMIRGSVESLRKDGGEVFGTKGGDFYNEFDKSHLCTGRSNDPCSQRGDKVLMVTKWLLRKIQTADGKTIDYQYDVHQRKLASPFTKEVSYITSHAYPKTILYNDGKHKVDFVQENRPEDDRGPSDFMRSRIKEVVISTKVKNLAGGEDDYQKVRSYAFGYYNGNDQQDKDNNGYVDIAEKLGVDDKGEPIENKGKSSYLTQIQEFDKNGKSLPPVRFSYTQVDLDNNHPNASDSIYLSSIDNGYGGMTKFVYEGFNIKAKNSLGADKGQNLMRVRVTEKDVVDSTKDKKSYKETYSYGPAEAYQEVFRNTTIQALKNEEDQTQTESRNRVVAQESEFLGHDTVETRMYDFNSDKLLKHAKFVFYQVNKSEKCFEPHPAKGQIQEQISYDTEGHEVAKVQNEFKIRFGANSDINSCDRTRYRQPY